MGYLTSLFLCDLDRMISVHLYFYCISLVSIELSIDSLRKHFYKNTSFKGKKWLKAKWYFVTKIVLTYWEKNCSCDREILLKFDAEGREVAKCLRSLEQCIQTVKGQNNFWKQNAFLTCFWRFLISDKLEQLELKLEKIIGI